MDGRVFEFKDTITPILTRYSHRGILAHRKILADTQSGCPPFDYFNTPSAPGSSTTFSPAAAMLLLVEEVSHPINYPQARGHGTISSQVIPVVLVFIPDVLHRISKS